MIALYAYAIAWWRDDPHHALAVLEESFALTEQGASDVVFDSGLMLLASIRQRLGDFRAALAALLAALEYDDRIGNRQQACRRCGSRSSPCTRAGPTTWLRSASE